MVLRMRDVRSPGKNRARGRYAEVPGQIPLRGWFDILRRLIREFGRKDMTITAAGISFFALFAVISAVAAFVSLYGLLADPQTVVTNMQALEGFVPTDVVVSIIDRMLSVAGQAQSIVIIVGALSLIFAVWSAQQGVAALMIALNVAYLETMPHGPVMHMFKSLFIAIEVIGGLLLIGVLAIGLPVLAAGMGGDFRVLVLVRAVGMALGGLVLLLGLAALYRWVPDRRPPRWRWVGIGAGLVVAFWTIGSILFSIVLAYSNSYTVMYGSLSAVVTLLMLTYVTVVTVLVGAEFNAQMEYQTEQDTTIESPRPMGERGAWVADHAARDNKRPNDE